MTELNEAGRVKAEGARPGQTLTLTGQGLLLL